jgi:DNA polymerase III alpha subunit (gram-positive type)
MKRVKKTSAKKYQSGGGTSRIQKRVAKNEAKKQLDQVKGERKAIQTKAKEESKNIKAVNKNTRSRMEGYESTKDRRQSRNEDARKTIGAARSKEKNVNVTGDRRIVGNNSTTTNTDNSTRNKTTSTNLSSSSSATQKQKQKQNTGSNKNNEKTGDVKRPTKPTRPKGPVPERPKGPVPERPKGPVPERPKGPNIGESPRSSNPAKPGMTREEIKKMIKDGKYKIMKKGGTAKPKAAYGMAVKPSMMKKGGAKKK